MSRHGVTDFLQTFRDITATFFDVETDLLVVVDERGNFERVNPAFEARLGRSEAEVLGRSIRMVVCENDLARFIRAFDMRKERTPFRLLRYGEGCVAVTLEVAVFDRTAEGLRGFLVMRPLQAVSDAG